MPDIAVSTSFDNAKAIDFRFLYEAARLGDVHLYLWSDAVVEKLTGAAPTFPLEERAYLVQAIRHVKTVTVVDALASADALPAVVAAGGTAIWAVPPGADTPRKRAACEQLGITCRAFTPADLAGFPKEEVPTGRDGVKRIVVTGCYDWFHSGHVRFFEEVSEHGELHVVVGHDANIRLLKGEGHPMYSEDERRFIVQSIRYVQRAYISSGDGWMDAEPEIARIQPDTYAVNEDGDRPEKQAFCKKHNLEYLVLKRTPKEGLPKRQSTDLRGF